MGSPGPAWPRRDYSPSPAVLWVAVRGPLLADVGQSEEQGLGARPGGRRRWALSPQGRGARVPRARGHGAADAAARRAPMDGYAAQTAPGPGGGRYDHQVGGGSPPSCGRRWRERAAEPRERGRGWGPTLAAPGLLGSEAGVSTASAGRPATETRAWGAASGGWSATGVGCSRTEGPELDGGVGGQGREDGQSPGRAERRCPGGNAQPRVSSASRGAGGGNRRGGRRGAVEVLKILARDPRSNTATFMSWP